MIIWITSLLKCIYLYLSMGGCIWKSIEQKKIYVSVQWQLNDLGTGIHLIIFGIVSIGYCRIILDRHLLYYSDV